MTQEEIYPFDESLKPVEDVASWDDDHADVPPNANHYTHLLN